MTIKSPIAFVWDDARLWGDRNEMDSNEREEN
jgi:hypothetical protein